MARHPLGNAAAAHLPTVPEPGESRAVRVSGGRHPWYNGTWHRRSRRWLQLADNRLCLRCRMRGQTVLATVVDHIERWRTPSGDNRRLFDDTTNWQPLCATCHSAGKQREEHRGYSAACGVDGLPLDRAHPANRGRGGASEILGTGRQETAGPPFSGRPRIEGRG